MFFAILVGLCVDLSWGFRGPHHPRSCISHHHYSPQKEGLKLTQDAELLHDATHLKEDMDALAVQQDLSKMSETELEFLWFKLHDVDNNMKLDGLEILHAYQHLLHEHDDDDQEKNIVEQGKEEDEFPWIVELIDRALDEDDSDHDGYLAYSEFVVSRQRNQTQNFKDKKLLIDRQISG